MTTVPRISDVPLAPPPTSLATHLAWGVLCVLLIWSWEGADMRPLDLIRDSANMKVFLQEFFPPNFHDWRIYLREMVITIHIAIWGTVLAVICAIPCGLASVSYTHLDVYKRQSIARAPLRCIAGPSSMPGRRRH